ncbi:MAG: MaoC family dehydratase N-terminal domain-containing protein [Deltaproteobacteria bacterium]|nr:MaoC family dehydratase N-terminal domain-containing protein [Deltaproteobacteria bacterium]
MIAPEKSQLPLKAHPQFIEVNDEQIQKFHKAFRDGKSKQMPATFTAMAMKGIFEIVDSLQTDWRKLLHATQSFTYHSAITSPSKIRAEAKLMDCKWRAGMYWLSFVIEVYEEPSQKLLITSKSLLMVKAE